ncbi:GntR family transcriptional regulator [Gordonia sputi]|uniref:GntR family transcriptional regulator n=1 Tax=Gordonia sputi TaxID=36823 RepID=UPI002044014E|nr:GntR family transcriptional regulator [Gordonia sputi]MCM3895885.1 GntR family transcriptional regulator [Gordonia sputi]
MAASREVSPSRTLAESWTPGPVGRVAAPLREQVIDALRAAILDFTLAPGQRLIERELIEQLGVSRTTVREALRELTSEGLITVVPQKGAIVSSPSVEEAQELYEARRRLEGLLVRRFVERAAKSQIIALAAAAEAFAEATESGEPLRILDAVDDYHAVIVAGARSPVLESLVGNLQSRLRVLRAQGMPADHSISIDKLRGVVDAARDGDADRAEELYDDHLRAAADNAVRSLRRLAV